MARNYNADEVFFGFGAIKAQELVQGEFIRIQYNKDQLTLVMSNDGKGTRSRSKDKSAKITLTAMQSSPINAALSAILNADLTLPNGAGVAPLAVRDRSGFSLHAAATAWITKWPDASYDMTAKERVWVFETDDLESFLGGN